MTELAAGRVYTATPCTLLVYYTERVTEQLDFPALLICGCTVNTTLAQLHHSRMLSPEYFPVYPMESVSANNCRSVFASSTPTSKATLTTVRRLLALESGS